MEFSNQAGAGCCRGFDPKTPGRTFCCVVSRWQTFTRAKSPSFSGDTAARNVSRSGVGCPFTYNVTHHSTGYIVLLDLFSRQRRRGHATR
jgi:hypothetical protein